MTLKINYAAAAAAAVPFAASAASSALCPFDRDAARPAATPPGWVFPIVWYSLYALMGAAWYRAVSSYGLASAPSLALGGTQVLLTLWSYVQSCLNKDREATWVLLLIVLAASYAALLTDDTGKLLLLPLIVWCSFATYLNAQKAEMTAGRAAVF